MKKKQKKSKKKKKTKKRSKVYKAQSRVRKIKKSLKKSKKKRNTKKKKIRFKKLTKNGRPKKVPMKKFRRKNSEKNWTKKFQKNLDEKIPKKFVIVRVNWGQGTVARHGRCRGKARVTEIPEGAKPPRPPLGGKAQVTEIPEGGKAPPDPPTTAFQKICPPGKFFEMTLKKKTSASTVVDATFNFSAEKNFDRKIRRQYRRRRKQLGGSGGRREPPPLRLSSVRSVR